MTGKRDGDRDDDERRETPDGNAGDGGGLIGGIRSLLEALADAERDGTSRVGRTRRRSRGRFSIESGFSGRVGRPTRRSGENAISDRSPPASADDEYHVDVRHDDEGRLLVVADLPDVDADDLTVGLDEETNELVVGVGDRAVERLPLPWPVDDVEGRFNHGVLELRITATEEAS